MEKISGKNILINLLNNQYLNSKHYENNILIENKNFNHFVKNNKINYELEFALEKFNLKILSNADFENKKIDTIFLIDKNKEIEENLMIDKNVHLDFLFDLIYLIIKNQFDYNKEFNLEKLKDIYEDKNYRHISNEDNFLKGINDLFKFKIIEVSEDKSKFIFSSILIYLIELKEKEIIDTNVN